MTKKDIQNAENDQEVENFFSKATELKILKQATKDTKPAKLIFALDATASRQPTWDLACTLQSLMFQSVMAIASLEMQLVFYRGFNECKASGWIKDSKALTQKMGKISCMGGQSQIARILKHALKEAQNHKINAVVFVGDAMEEDPDHLCHLAGELGLLNVPLFIFQEGKDPYAKSCFQQMAKLSKGVWHRFDSGSPDELEALLRGAAIYAAGGFKALNSLKDSKNKTLSQFIHKLEDQHKK